LNITQTQTQFFRKISRNQGSLSTNKPRPHVKLNKLDQLLFGEIKVLPFVRTVLFLKEKA